MTAHCVLVVDDDVDLRGALAAVLESHGYGVVEANHGREALDVLTRDPDRFCLIVLDLFMPEMDGWTFLAEQGKDSRLVDKPVLVVTADPIAARRAAARGVVAAMTKPVDFGRLLCAVRQHC